MLANYVRFMHIQEKLAKRNGDYVTFEYSNVEKEILLRVLQNEKKKIQNDLNAIQDYLAGLLLKHLKTLFCVVLVALICMRYSVSKYFT